MVAGHAGYKTDAGPEKLCADEADEKTWQSLSSQSLAQPVLWPGISERKEVKSICSVFIQGKECTSTREIEKRRQALI